MFGLGSFIVSHHFQLDFELLDLIHDAPLVDLPPLLCWPREEVRCIEIGESSKHKNLKSLDISTGENEDMAVSRNEENVIRVSNLSEDTHEADLRELFSRFGPPTRVYVAIDHKFGLSRGFGYVNFVNRENAERAINKLNGFVYGSLILQVEWFPPRSLLDWDPNGNQAPQCHSLNQATSQASNLTAWSAWPPLGPHVLKPLFHL